MNLYPMVEHEWEFGQELEYAGWYRPISVTTDADAWFEQSSTANKGDDSALKVRSKSGNDAFRTIVRFALPSVPAGCELDSAELRLYAESAKSGRARKGRGSDPHHE